MEERALKMLGLMRKASALVMGEENASDSVLAGKARLLLIPSDGENKKKERAKKYVDGRSCILVELPYEEKIISEAVGVGRCTMAAVTDLGFADAFMKLLVEKDPDRYRQPAEDIHLKLSRVNQRKTEKPGKKARIK